MRLQSTLIAFVVAALVAVPTASMQAQLTPGPTACTNGSALTAMNPDAIACSGDWTGNDVNQMTAVLARMGVDFRSFVGGTAWTYLGTTDAGSTAGPFRAVPGSITGTLSLDNPIQGFFAIALKSSTNFSIYLFNGGPSGLSSVDFTTIGTSLNKKGVPQDLSHASLFDFADPPSGGTAPVSAVTVTPEPASVALLLTGFVAIGALRRRRRA